MLHPRCAHARNQVLALEGEAGIPPFPEAPAVEPAAPLSARPQTFGYAVVPAEGALAGICNSP